MGLSLMNLRCLSSSVHVAYYWKFFLMHYKQVLSALQSRSCLSYVSYVTTAAKSLRTVVGLTTIKFKHLISSMSGFALSYTANMFSLMILYDFCLLPAQFCYIIVYTRKVESCVKIADRCSLRKISNGAQNLVLRALHFKRYVSAAISQSEQA
jgi:hypothetical protein